MEETLAVPKEILFIINQVFEIEQKVFKLTESNTIQRNIDKLKEFFLDGLFTNQVGIFYYSPLGEEYNETRTDCEASIAGNSAENLIIVEVLKPIILLRRNNYTHIAQKAVVVAQSK